MATVMLEILDVVYSDVPVCKVYIFARDFEFLFEVNGYYGSRHSNPNFAYIPVLFIDHSTRLKLKVNMITHIKEKPSTTK